VAAVAGVDDDAADLEAESADERAFAVSHGSGFAGGSGVGDRGRGDFGVGLANFMRVGDRGRGCWRRRDDRGRGRLGGGVLLRGVLVDDGGDGLGCRLARGVDAAGQVADGKHISGTRLLEGECVGDGGRGLGPVLRRPHGGTGDGSLAAVDVDDEAVGIGKEKRGVFGDVVDVEHDASHVVGVLRRADLLEETVVGDGEALADEFLGEPGAVKVEIDAVGIGDACGFVGNVVAEIDGDARVGRR